MKIIKFRAWDGNKFYDSVINNGMDWDMMSDSPTGNPITQFTGLYDKNGTSIYEGDIMSDINGRLLLVEFIDNYLQIRLRLLKLTKDEYARVYDLGAFGGCKHIGIVGNVYENPELLNQ